MRLYARVCARFCVYLYECACVTMEVRVFSGVCVPAPALPHLTVQNISTLPCPLEISMHPLMRLKRQQKQMHMSRSTKPSFSSLLLNYAMRKEPPLLIASTTAADAIDT